MYCVLSQGVGGNVGGGIKRMQRGMIIVDICDSTDGELNNISCCFINLEYPIEVKHNGIK